MRLMWTSAYLAELSANLGTGAAATAASVGLSPAASKSFESSGSIVTDLALDSLTMNADSVAAWSLSTDAIAQSVFGCNARTVTGAQAEVCFTSFLKTKGARLFRRSLTADEVADNLEFFRSEALQGPRASQEGFRQGLASLLTHPDFLYLRDAAVKNSNALDPFSIASRVSFGLTGKGPDDALFAAALNGSLSDHAVLKTHIERILETPAAKEHSQGFYRQWLGYSSGATAYSPAFLAGLDPTGVRDAASAELDAFTAELTWKQKASPSALLVSRWAPPVPSSLAAVYGVAPGVSELPSNRAGLITRVGLLATGGDDWHVVARGLTVIQKLMCRTIGAPALDVSAAAKKAEALKVSNADRIASVTSSANCQGCHKTINPIGAARSDFDSIGRAVTVEKHFAGGVLDFEVPVVSSASMMEPLGTSSMASGSVDLSSYLAASPDFSACFSQQFVRHLMGRDDSSDACLSDDGAVTAFKGGSIIDTMKAVMTSPEFVVWRD